MKKSATFLIIFFLSVLLPASPARSQVQLDAFSYHLQAGTYEASHGNISAAMADLQSALDIDPTRSEGWYQFGLLEGQIADFRAAESAFRHAIQIMPGFAAAHYSLALILTASPKSKLDWREVIVECGEALKYKPDYAEALNLLGSGLIATGETDAAIRELERALKLKPSLAGAHFNYATALEKANRFDDATRAYRTAIATKPVYPEAIGALGKLLLKMDKTPEAEKELEKALHLNPDLADVHYAMGRALEALGKKSDAAIEFDIAACLAQRETDAVQYSILSNTGIELASKGDLSGASDSLRKAIALRPDLGIPHFNLGLILANAGDLAGAVQELTKAISLMPSQAKAWLELGRVLRLQGEDQGALEAVHWAARLAPTDAAIHAEFTSLMPSSLLPAPPSSKSTIRGVTAASETGPTLSIRQPKVGAASDTAPDHIAFAAQLATNGDSTGARGELIRALALQPDSVDARRLLAASYRENGDHRRAILEYRKILWILPGDAATHSALGEVLLDRGDAQMASDEFEMALATEPNFAEAKAGRDRAKKALSAH
jgi:tetratricopeptide (TPR) repeat protein